MISNNEKKTISIPVLTTQTHRPRLINCMMNSSRINHYVISINQLIVMKGLKLISEGWRNMIFIGEMWSFWDSLWLLMAILRAGWQIGYQCMIRRGLKWPSRVPGTTVPYLSMAGLSIPTRGISLAWSRRSRKLVCRMSIWRPGRYTTLGPNPWIANSCKSRRKVILTGATSRW